MQLSEPTTQDDRSAEIADVLRETVHRRAAGEALNDEAVLAAHAHLLPELQTKLQALRRVEEAEKRASSASGETHASEIPGDGPRSSAELPRTTLAGCELLEELHRGGQGIVYRAIQTSTRREVAVKVMKEGPFAGPADRARFDREVQTLGALNHPNIVTIHDSGSAAGSLYFVMNYISGRPLDEHVQGNRLSIRETLKLFAKVCHAVNAAHLKGIMHRDLKPGNIRVDDRGEPHILDFGLAKSAGQGDAWTITGQFVGTMAWASPEQAEGIPSRVDVRSDVYSLGVLLYHLLTGHFPYNTVGNIHTVIDNIVHAQPANPRRINRAIDGEVATVLLKCLSKEPPRRYQSAGELGRDLEHYLAGAPIDAKRDSTLYVLRKQLRRHRLPLSVAAGFVLLLMSSGVVAWTLYLRSQSSLWEAYLAQARAGRMTGRAGQRLDSLAALAKAAAIRPSMELRNEAIAALALTDVRITQQVATDYTTDVAQCGFSAHGDLYFLWGAATEKTVVRRLADEQTVLTLPAVQSGSSRAVPRLSRDGRYLARAIEGQCAVWDIERVEMTTSFPVNVTTYFEPLDFSPDNQELAVGCMDGTIHVHSLRSDGARVSAAAHSPINCVRYDPAGGRLATSSTRSLEVLIRDARDGAVLHTLNHAARVWRIAWSPDGRQLASACGDGQTYVWDTETGGQQVLLSGHTSEVSKVGFDPTGKLLFSSSWDGTTRLWDPRDGVSLLMIPAMAGESFFGDSRRLGFKTYASGLSVGTAEIVHGSPLRTLVGVPGNVSREGCKGSQTNANGRWMVAASEAGVRVWDLERETHAVLLPTAWSESAGFNPDMSELITVSETGVLAWPVKVNEEIMRLGPPSVLLPGGREALMQSCFASDGHRLVVASLRDGHAMVFDRDVDNEPWTIGPHPRMRYLSISPDDRWLATGTWRGEGVRIWDLASGQLLHELPIEQDASVGFSPDGRWLVTSGADHILWRTDTWQPAARFERPAYTSVPGPIAFSPDGSVVALAGRDPSIQVVDLGRQETIARFECPGVSRFEALSFSSDGRRLLLPVGRMVYVWDLPAVRTELAAIHLDWDLPPYSAQKVSAPAQALKIEIVVGDAEPEPAS